MQKQKSRLPVLSRVLILTALGGVIVTALGGVIVYFGMNITYQSGYTNAAIAYVAGAKAVHEAVGPVISVVPVAGSFDPGGIGGGQRIVLKVKGANGESLVNVSGSPSSLYCSLEKGTETVQFGQVIDALYQMSEKH